MRKELAIARRPKNSRLDFGSLFFAEDDFAVTDELVVQPQLVFVGGRFAAWAWRAAEQAHARGRLKNVRRKGTAVHIKFDAQIAGVGDPGDLVAVVEHDGLRDESNEYGAFRHFSVWLRFSIGAHAPNMMIAKGR